VVVCTGLAVIALAVGVRAEELPRYYAHPAVLDEQGVIAPWYAGRNGQLDLRVRVAAETLKRYPWVLPPSAPYPAPHYVYSGLWSISPAGEIAIPKLSDWANGDLCQRLAYVLSGLVDYYAYSGDPAAIAHLSVAADTFLRTGLTPPDHPWPRFPVSCPVRGKPYGSPDTRGFIQIDIAAELGYALVRSYELTGERRWLAAAAHWGDLLAGKRSREPGVCPWARYANPEDVPWEDTMTGGVAFVLTFLDELIRVGYTGPDNEIVRARDEGRAYLRDVLLPRWTEDEVWGRNYWDWPDPVQAENVTEFVARYLMAHPDAFPAWREDARNVLSLFMHHTCVSTQSMGNVYSGAWAYPESSGCCGRSLWYGPLELAPVFAEYGARADSDWARELGRRQMILATYDVHETGVVEDNIDGGPIVAADWFKIAHPMALKHVLNALGWLPELAPARESHVLRSTGVVREVEYGLSHVAWTTWDAPAGTITVLRLPFQPADVHTPSGPLPLRRDGSAPGYVVAPIGSGDFLVSVRHDGERRVAVSGPADSSAVGWVAPAMDPRWTRVDDGGVTWIARDEGAAADYAFTGRQIRVLGDTGPGGGQADVWLDGAKQLGVLDCWTPEARRGDVVFSASGLAPGRHTVRFVARGRGNPMSRGARVALRSALWSDEEGVATFGSGAGPTGAQRFLLGSTQRADYVDSAGNAWRPATEVIVRTGDLTDAVARTWWTAARCHDVAGTADPTLYRHGIHAPEFTVFFTVGPGRYHLRLKLAETRRVDARDRAMDVWVNAERKLQGLDIAATAGGYARAADLVWDDIAPEHGMIALRLVGCAGAEAIAQAVEIGRGTGGTGSEPKCLPVVPSVAGNLLANPGFEAGALGTLGRMGSTAEGLGWKYLFASPGVSYIWGESAYVIHPETGLPHPRTGKEALRTHTDGSGHTIVYQDVDARPSTRYRASVWVETVDLHGKGFGRTAGDEASLWVQELSARGELLATHPRASVTDSGGYRQLAVELTTGPNAAKLRFILEARIGGHYNEGHVTWDDCELAAAP
jgi:hypothetical protein